MEWNGMNPNLMCISISIVVVIITITIHFTQMASLGRLFARSFVRSFVCAEREREREREKEYVAQRVEKGGVILEARVRSIISEITTTMMNYGWMMVDTVVLASLTIRQLAS